MIEVDWIDAPDLAGIVVPFPRTPRRCVAVIPTGRGFRAAVLLPDGRPSSRFGLSAEFASAWLAGEAARQYSRMTGLPLRLDVVRVRPDDGPLAA